MQARHFEKDAAREYSYWGPGTRAIVGACETGPPATDTGFPCEGAVVAQGWPGRVGRRRARTL